MRRCFVVFVAVTLVALPLTGCRTSNEGSWIGTGVGAVSGALIGGIIGNQSGNKWKGALIGAAAGAMAGYIIGTELGAQGGSDHASSNEHARSKDLFDRAVRSDDPRDAISYYKQAIDMDPIHPEPYNNLGLRHLQRGDKEQARASFENALAADRDFTPARDNLAKLAGEAP